MSTLPYMRIAAAAGLLLVLSGAARAAGDGTPPLSGSPRADGRASSAPLGQRIAREAGSLVGAESLRIPHDDCSGFVQLVYRRAHVALDGSSQELRRVAARRHALRFRQARPGDLVFFRDTIPGKSGITHVGIVESVTSGGATTFVHRANSGVVRSQLDLHRPRTGRDARGRVHNDILRRRTVASRARLTGELFAGFASADRLALSPGRRP